LLSRGEKKTQHSGELQIVKRKLNQVKVSDNNFLVVLNIFLSFFSLHEFSEFSTNE
jgi:hypothetical protein